MKVNRLRKSFAIFMVAFVLYWTAFPSVSMAIFITPGKAMNYGPPISGMSPITGVQPMAPGNVYHYGTVIDNRSPIDGVTPITSGQFIVPPYQGGNGQIIPPNIISNPRYGNFLITGPAMTNGEAVTTGEGMTGGEASSNGSAVEGGTAAEGGDASSNGQAVEGGTSPNGGNGSTNGEAINGGEGSTKGEAPTGGDSGSNGNITTGDSGTVGETPTGSPTEGGESGSGDGINGSADEIPSALNVLLPGTDTSRDIYGIINGHLTSAKEYITSAGRTILEASTSLYAGYKFERLPSGNYKVVGKTQLSNPILNHFYHNFKKYEMNGQERYMPVGGANPGLHKVNSFFNSKGFTDFSSPGAIAKSTWSSVKTGLNEGFNIFSKKFWSGSNMLRLNGPVNIALSSFNSIYDYSSVGDKEKSKLGYGSNFAADLTVDVGIGVGTTVLSGVASSMAAGALAGSAVPGLGTVVGAVAGLLVGFGANYFFNGTSVGDNAKKWVSGKLNTGYKWLGDKIGGAKKFLGFG